MSYTLRHCRNNHIATFYVRKISLRQYDVKEDKWYYGVVAYVRPQPDRDDLDNMILQGFKRVFKSAYFLPDLQQSTSERTMVLRKYVHKRNAKQTSGFDISLTAIAFNVNNPIQASLLCGKTIPLNIYAKTKGIALKFIEPHYCYAKHNYNGNVRDITNKIDNTICDYKTFLYN